MRFTFLKGQLILWSTPFFSLKLFSRIKFLKQIILIKVKGRKNVLRPQIQFNFQNGAKMLSQIQIWPLKDTE